MWGAWDRQHEPPWAGMREGTRSYCHLLHARAEPAKQVWLQPRIQKPQGRADALCLRAYRKSRPRCLRNPHEYSRPLVLRGSPNDPSLHKAGEVARRPFDLPEIVFNPPYVWTIEHPATVQAHPRQSQPSFPLGMHPCRWWLVGTRGGKQLGRWRETLVLSDNQGCVLRNALRMRNGTLVFGHSNPKDKYGLLR